MLYYGSYLLKVLSQFSSFYFSFLCYTCKLAGEIVFTKAVANLTWPDLTWKLLYAGKGILTAVNIYCWSFSNHGNKSVLSSIVITVSPLHIDVWKKIE